MYACVCMYMYMYNTYPSCHAPSTDQLLLLLQTRSSEPPDQPQSVMDQRTVPNIWGNDSNYLNLMKNVNTGTLKHSYIIGEICELVISVYYAYAHLNVGL